ncbi:MAG TPA: hypothetical protein VNO30_28865 [Kofleriaceae bacterium]|nr:hypothetical protein [Kofleriaceae bacterium]
MLSHGAAEGGNLGGALGALGVIQAASGSAARATGPEEPPYPASDVLALLAGETNAPSLAPGARSITRPRAPRRLG